MVKKNLLLVWLAVFLALLATAFAENIRCYHCDTEGSDDDKDCANIENAVDRECRGGEKLCTKIVLDGEITRGCYMDIGNSKKEEGCETKGDTTTCYCGSDLCNGATAATTSTITFMAISCIVARLM